MPLKRREDGQWDWIRPTDLPRLPKTGLIAVDLETRDDGLNQKLGPGGVLGMGYVLGISVAVDESSWYIPIRHPESDNFDVDAVRRWAADNLVRHGQPIVGANILYDLEWLWAENIPIAGEFHDVQIAEPLLDENRGRYNLDSLTRQYLPEEYHKQGDELDELAKQYLGDMKGDVGGHIWRLPASLVGAYAEIDALGTLKVFKEQQPLLERDGLLGVYDLERRLIPLTLKMRLRGVPIDLDKAARVESSLKSKLIDSKKLVHHIAGRSVNVGSSRDMAKTLDEFGCPYPMTEKGNPSISKEYLAALPHPFGKAALETKQIEHMLSTFIEGLIGRHCVNGRIHTQFNQLRGDEYGTVSGRWSSSNPNLQQIPSRHPDYAPLLRSLFIPEYGQEWWKSDWSQIEFRILVHYASAEGLPMADQAAKRYQEDPSTDFHEWCASMINMPRRYAKDINFGLVYGMGIPKLAKSIGMTVIEARPVFGLYHNTLPFVKRLSENVQRAAKHRGYIRTLLGRRRRFDLYEPDTYDNEKVRTPLPYNQAMLEYGHNIRVAHLHKALNSLIQGSAADLMKKAMVDCYESGLFDDDVMGVPYLTVHDELDGAKDKGEKGNKYLTEVLHVMENCIKLNVPVLTDAGVGEDWWNVSKFQDRKQVV